MQFLEVRRHTMRVSPGQHISQEGVTLARNLGGTMGKFNLVITSTMPRAFETAIAMGYAVDEQIEGLGMVDDGVQEEVKWDNTVWDVSFERWSRAYKLNGATNKYCKSIAKIWRKLLTNVPDEGAVLIISHGGIIEAGAIACFPDADPVTWGGFCNYCEGVRIGYDEQHFVSIEILRLHQ